MSETSPQSLASVIDQQTGGGDGTAVAPSVKMPSLASLIDQSVGSGLTNSTVASSDSGDVTPSQTTAAKVPAPPAAPAVGQGAADQTAQATQAATQAAQEQARLRALLSARGFDVPEVYSTDDAIADAIAAELDRASALEKSEDYQRFLAWQAEQAKAAATAQTTKPPEPPVTQGPSESAILNAVTKGYVSFDAASKKWAPQHPSFAAHADSMNQRDEQQRQIAAEFASDPHGYIQRQIQEGVKAALESLKPTSQQPVDEIKQVLDGLKQQQIQAQQSQIDAWAMQNASKLYDASGNPTGMHAFYNQIYQDLTKQDPTFDQRPLERHNEVLRRLQVAEQAFRPALPPAPAQPAVPKPSFLDSAARRNGTNRLSEYVGPAKNSTGVQVPKGKLGMPTLAGVIEQQTALQQ